MVSIIAQYIVNCKNKSLEMHNILYSSSQFRHKNAEHATGQIASADGIMSVSYKYCFSLAHKPGIFSSGKQVYSDGC